MNKETFEAIGNTAISLAFNSARQLVHQQTIDRIDAILARCRKEDAEREERLKNLKGVSHE